MIRIKEPRAKLLERIDEIKPSWIARARTRTRAYAKARKYTGGSEFWGEIKDAYIVIQHEKCAYCETKLAGRRFASKVHEVEHFRPKSSVKAWPDPALAHLQGFVAPCATGGASAKGYYLLAYHPFNYAIACTRCNSTLKSNYFPVRAARNVKLADPSLGWHEEPLLVYPLSDLDDDPESVITFDGVLARPVDAEGRKHERAVVSIAFFQLNHEDLTSRRVELLWPLWIGLETRRSAATAELRRDADEAVTLACRDGAQFAACARAFVALHASDRQHAKALARAARDFIERGP